MKVSWKVYTDQRFSDQDKAVQAALQAAEKAVTKAEVAADKRFDAVNEFRGQLADQASRLMSRAEYLSNQKALEDKISDLTDRINRNEGRGTGLSQGWGIFVALATIAILLVTLIVRVK